MNNNTFKIKLIKLLEIMQVIIINLQFIFQDNQSKWIFFKID